jgi:hypothetical protein
MVAIGLLSLVLGAVGSGRFGLDHLITGRVRGRDPRRQVAGQQRSVDAA